MEENITTDKPVKQKPGAQGRPRLSRKRYAEAVKFLKEIITASTGKHDDKSVNRGLRATEQLMNIYSRFDAAIDREERRKRREDEAEEDDIPEPVQAQESAEQAAARLIDSVRQVGANAH